MYLKFLNNKDTKMYKMESLLMGKTHYKNVDPTSYRQCIVFSRGHILCITISIKLLNLCDWCCIPVKICNYTLTSIHCWFSNSLKVHTFLMMQTVYQPAMQYTISIYYVKICDLYSRFIKFFNVINLFFRRI